MVFTGWQPLGTALDDAESCNAVSIVSVLRDFFNRRARTALIPISPSKKGREPESGFSVYFFLEASIGPREGAAS